ncbi:MAG: zinc ribbon domain-containing protein [Elusimicrobia bacterium]|nr:zinc ribbon domain-containing protein [Elusimicrobiota bacterium]
MKCPECGHIVQHVDKACLRCGADLLSAYERRAWRGLKRGRRAPGDRRPRTAAVGGWLSLGAVLLMAAWVAAGRARTAVVPEGAFRDEAGELAFLVPPGWKLTAGPAAGWRFQRVAELDGPGGRIVVEAAGGGLPLAPHLGALVREEFNGRRIRLEGPAGLLLDGVEGRRLGFRAGPDAVGEVVLVQGRGRSYLLRLYSSDAEVARVRPGWNALLASVRLTRGGR